MFVNDASSVFSNNLTNNSTRKVRAEGVSSTKLKFLKRKYRRFMCFDKKFKHTLNIFNVIDFDTNNCDNAVPKFANC